MKTSLFLVLAGFVVLSGCQERTEAPINGQPPSSQSEQKAAPSLTESSLLDALRSNDFGRVIAVMNEVKGARYSGHLVPLLVRLWVGEELNGIDEKFVRQPRIRIELADVLAQMERNGFQGLDRAAYARYAKEQALSSDPDVARQAILVLGIAGTAEDLPVLEKVALQDDPDRYRAAIVAIADNCAATASFVENLERQLPEQGRKELLRKTWQEFQPLRMCARR